MVVVGTKDVVVVFGRVVVAPAADVVVIEGVVVVPPPEVVVVVDPYVGGVIRELSRLAR